MSKRLEINDVNAWFGPNQVLENVSLTVEPKSVTALIGPSGCGKSTFLRILNRMHEETPSARMSGSVRLDDRDIYDGFVAADIRRVIGMVFQRPNPFPTMSIAQNVTAGPRLNGVRKSPELDVILERSLRAAALWNEVKDRLNKPAVALSGGQQQRLCIARALANEPEVLLMDEPCSALDPISTLKIEDLIADLKDDYTVVIVTHNMQQAARVSNTTAFFTVEGASQPGRLIEVGPTNVIFTKPRDQRTEGYITGRFG